VTQRKVFGKPLHSQAVIRAKLAAMISRAESELSVTSIALLTSGFARRTVLA